MLMIIDDLRASSFLEISLDGFDDVGISEKLA